MDVNKLTEQVLRIINANYSNINVIDISADLVYYFNFDNNNKLIISKTSSYTDFIEHATSIVHKDELNGFFDSLSLNKLEIESQKGNIESKYKYRKLCDAGDYRWFINIINYLPLDGKKLIFMMSEDVNERQLDTEENTIKLETDLANYKNKLTRESESISDAIYQINNLLENGASTDNVMHIRDTKAYINSIFNKVSADHPELNDAIMNKIIASNNYKKPTILIVDDSSIIRNSLKRIFVRDFDIMMAKDGNEAINLLTTNVINASMNDGGENICAVLLDLVMPGTDGFAVLEFMKKFNLFTKIPVAIISGDETRETRKKVYQYDIVDMLEKPFNTDNIRRRISKIINLYLSSNNLANIVEVQNEELRELEEKNADNIKAVISQIVNNIVNNDDSVKLKRIARIIAIGISNKFPNYKIDSKKVDAIVNTCALYNIGAIAMDDKMVITSGTIKQEIEYGLSILSTYVNDEYERNVAENIIKYSCEMYDGTGYPNGIVGGNIPIEAQITNMAVRLNQYVGTKNFNAAIKSIIETQALKYNEDIIEVVNDNKKEIKNIA